MKFFIQLSKKKIVVPIKGSCTQSINHDSYRTVPYLSTILKNKLLIWERECFMDTVPYRICLRIGCPYVRTCEMKVRFFVPC